MNEKQKKPLAVVTTGGSGGHIFPAEVISEALIKKGFDVVFITDKRGKAFQGLKGVKVYNLMAEHVMGRSFFGKIAGAFKLYCGAVQALFLLKKLKPSVVVGVGGYASMPAVLAAHLWHIPVVLHEQNAVLGRANRVLAHNTRIIAVSFEPTLRVPNDIRTVLVGMPARAEVLARANAPYPLTDDGFNLLIFGGSQGASFFSKRLPEAFKLLPKEVASKMRVTAQVRAEDMEKTKEVYAQIPFKSVVLKSFFDNMPELIERSHLIIGRAGASTITEAAIIGRPAILVPLPTSADNHQMENAKRFSDAGAGWLMSEGNYDPEKFAARLAQMVNEPEILYQAGSQAHKIARPDAPEKVADVVADIAKGKGA